MELTQRLDLTTASVAYDDSGRGEPAVVFLHGAGVDHSIFDAQAAALLETGARVIRWDLRAHGASTIAEGVPFRVGDAIDDLDALLRHVDVPAPVLVGLSLGGNMAQEYARRHPDRVAGVVVLDSAWNAGPLTAMERFALRIAAPLLRLVPARRLPGILARASAVAPDAIARTEELFSRLPHGRFLEVWTATTALVDPDPAYRSPVPLALVRGAHDEAGNIAKMMPQWAAAEGIDEHVVPDAGHIVTLDAPDAVSEILLQVLSEWSKG